MLSRAALFTVVLPVVMLKLYELVLGLMVR